MFAVHMVEGALGTAVVGIVLFDIFQSVIVPRPARAGRVSALLTRFVWRAWRAAALRIADGLRRESFLAVFAPFLLVTMLVFWVVLLIVGYGLILHALAFQISPRPIDLGEAMYFAGTSLLTLGYGDIVPVGGAARAVALASSATGLGVVAIVAAFLFSLFGSFQRREVFVVTLNARGGAPPSGLVVLETHKQFELEAGIGPMFVSSQLWMAEVLDNHLAYPILAYFRSSHVGQSWLASLGAVLDAAVLVLSTIDDVPRGEARLTYEIGTHLIGDLGSYFGLSDEESVGIERREFEQARERLGRAGYALRPADGAWKEFAELRSVYAATLVRMARYWAIPPAQWVGDRSILH